MSSISVSEDEFDSESSFSEENVENSLRVNNNSNCNIKTLSSGPESPESLPSPSSYSSSNNSKVSIAHCNLIEEKNFINKFSPLNNTNSDNLAKDLIKRTSSSVAVSPTSINMLVEKRVPRTVPCIILTSHPEISSSRQQHSINNLSSIPASSQEAPSIHNSNNKSDKSSPPSFFITRLTSSSSSSSSLVESPKKLEADDDKITMLRGPKFDGMRDLVKLDVDNEDVDETKQDERKRSEVKKDVLNQSKVLSFGIDRILSREEKEIYSTPNNKAEESEPRQTIFSVDFLTASPQHHQHTNYMNQNQCSECFFLSRFCRKVQFAPSLPTISPSNFIHHSAPIFDTSAMILNPNGYGTIPQTSIPQLSSFSLGSSLVSCNTGNGRRKRSWSRAVFSNLQRKGLEKRFQIQKYITKPDRRQLAAALGLSDAQVKVWFQNRRMKWRHSKEGKLEEGKEIAP